MAQRVMIGMMVGCGPDLLIADEPTTGLDVTIQAQIFDLIQEMQTETGMSVLLITHDLGVVAETCHRVAVMQSGRLVEIAPVDALFARPQHPYTIRLLAAMTATALERLIEVGGRRYRAVAVDAWREARVGAPTLVEVGPGHLVLCHPISDSAEAAG
jgi:ABC-type dipeptide/oligopeptide/nickel transport system ATPase component